MTNRMRPSSRFAAPGYAPPRCTKHGTHGSPFETPGQRKLGHIYK